MRILNLMFSFTVGGTEHLVTDISNNLVACGNEVYIFIVNALVDESMIKSLDSRIHIEQLNREVGEKNKFNTLVKIAKFIKKENIDVVHCNSLNAPELLLFAKIISPKLKVIYTVHGMCQYSQLNRIKKIYRNIICDRIIAISESVKQDIICEGANDEIVNVVYNAVDFSRIDQAVSGLNPHKFDPNNVVIGNAARFQPEVKGQDILIDSVKLLVNERATLKCIFAGAPDKQHSHQYDSTKSHCEKKYPNNMFFVGNIDNVAEFLNDIDIFILPSKTEGFGISLVEAMSMGIPCIASRLAGPEELLESGKRGCLFTPCDPVDLTHKIDDVIQNYSSEKEKAQNNIKYVRSEYSIDRMIEQLLKIYNER